MTERHGLRCLQNTFVLRMYRILNQAIEDLPAVKNGDDSRSDFAVVYVSTAGLQSPRIESPPSTVFLTETQVAWVGTSAFEVRWTSLAA